MSDGGPAAPPHRWIGKLVEIRAGEAAAVGYAGAYFFLLLSGYFILKPLREEMGMLGGVKNLSWLFLGTFITMLVMAPVFAALVTALPRRRFIPIVYRFFIANLLIFYLLLTFLDGPAKVNAARAFFIWLSVFNLFAMSVFWGFMADLFRSEQAKRLFGFIGAGGTLGAIAGPLLASVLLRSKLVHPVQLLLLSAVLLEAAVQCSRRLVRIFGIDAGVVGSKQVSPASLLTGVRLVASSPYLRTIGIYLLFYAHTSTVLYMTRAQVVDAAKMDSVARTEYFANTELAINVLALLFQGALSGRIIRAIGIGWSLASIAMVTLVGFAVLALRQDLTLVAGFFVLKQGAHFGIAKPAQEALFTVVGRDAKYKSKSFIDTVVYRGGDALSAQAFAGLTQLRLGMSEIAFVTVPLAAAWIWTALSLGRRHSALDRTVAPPQEAVAISPGTRSAPVELGRSS